MAISDYLAGLRAHVGTDLLLVPSVTAIIRDADGRVLVFRRADNGRWDLPAGSIDPGETPADAVVREVHEETGLAVRPTRVLGVFGGPTMRFRYPNGDLTEYLNIVFRCERVGGELQANDGEATDFRWCTRDEVATLGLAYPPELFGPEAEAAPVFAPATSR